MEAMNACISPSPRNLLEESEAGMPSRRRLSEIRRLKMHSNSGNFSEFVKKQSLTRNASHLCSVCFGGEVPSTADPAYAMEVELHSRSLYPSRRLVRSVSTPTPWKGGLFCTCNINKFYTCTNSSTANDTSVVTSHSVPMLQDLKGEMAVNMPESEMQTSVGPLDDDERNRACKGVNVNVAVEEPKGQEIVPQSRPSKSVALPMANSESISLLLKDSCPPHGTVSIIGRRREMEDAVAVVSSFFSLPKPTALLQNSLTGYAAPAPIPLHFFGVYDGHGGSQASIYCKNHFHEVLAKELRDASSFSRDLSYWSKVISACFMKMDMAVGGMCPNGGCSNGDVQMIGNCCHDPVAPENVGSTAVIAVVSPSQVVIANCGDSRAVLSRGGKAIPLSNDHKPEREDEMDRIEAAGGRVIFWNGYRVGGFLAMSRALGDRFLTENPDMILTASRDKTIIVWQLSREDGNFGFPKRILRGHNHFVSDVVTSSDGQFALSSSWDKTLRLWDLNTGMTTRRFVGHTGDVLSVSFSADNRQIVSGSRDRTIKLWNTLGECKYEIRDEGHTEWVSCVRFSPNPMNPVIVSAGWDKVVKVWELSKCKLRTNHFGHTGYINAVTVSPDGSLCASGGKDGITMLWDLNEGKHLYSLEAGDIINALTFSPNRYWLCAATASCIKIFDLESKSIVDEIKPDFVDVGKKAKDPECTSLAWSADGSTLFAGYTDSLIRVYSA